VAKHEAVVRCMTRHDYHRYVIQTSLSVSEVQRIPLPPHNVKSCHVLPTSFTNPIEHAYRQ